MTLHRYLEIGARDMRAACATRSRLGRLGTIAVAAALAGCAGVPPAPVTVTASAAAQLPRIEPVLRITDGVPVSRYAGALALARRLAGEARWASAAEAYRQAVAIHAGDAQVLNELGHAEAMLQRHAAAVAAFERAVALDPGRSDLLNNLGYALLLAGQPEKAVAALAEAVRLVPGYPAALANFALAEQQAAQARARILEVVAPGEAYAQTSSAAALAAWSPWEPASLPALAASTVSPPVLPPPLLELPLPPAPVLDAPALATDLGPTPRLQWLQADRAVLQLRSTLGPPEPPRNAPPAVADAGPVVARPMPRLRLEVANGAGRTGLARATASALRAGGQPAQRITNHSHYKVVRTEVQYRTAQDEAEAAELARHFAMPVVLVLNPKLAPGIGLRVLLGRDAAALAAQAQPLTQAA